MSESRLERCQREERAAARWGCAFIAATVVAIMCCGLVGALVGACVVAH